MMCHVSAGMDIRRNGKKCLKVNKKREEYKLREIKKGLIIYRLSSL